MKMDVGWCGRQGYLRCWCFTIAFVLPLNASSPTASGFTGVWKTYTSKKDVRDVAVKNGIVWAATQGGLFSYSLLDTVFEEFTTSEGLKTNDLTAITVDADGNVWVGALNGIVHAYTPATRQWRYLTDVYRSTAAGKTIKTLVAYGDTLYIGSELGLNTYLITRDQIGIDVKDFGANAQIRGNVTSVVVFRDSLWLGTSNGIAAAPLAHPNLRDPAAWRIWQSGLPSNNVTSLAVMEGGLYAATALGVALYNNGSAWSTIPGTTGRNVIRIKTGVGVLYGVTASELLTITPGGNVTVDSMIFSSLTSVAVENMSVILGSFGSGVYLKNGGMWQSRTPKGPPTNFFNAVTVDEEGLLWVGTGTNPGDGFLRFDGTTWKQYTAQQYPQLLGNSYYKVNIGKDNAKWVSSWGNGVALVDRDGNIRKVFNAFNGLPSTECSGCGLEYVVVAGVVTDHQGQSWICIRTARDSSTLVLVRSDSIVAPIKGPNPIFTDIVIDDYGTIWFSNWKRTDGNALGLFFYNNNGFPRAGTTRWSSITETDGLVGNQVRSVVPDLTGQVWVGTDKGISIITSPYNVRPPLAQYVPLRDQPINAMAVDPLNNKWVATPQGISVLSPDGITLLAHYSVENTDGKLIDNDVQSIAINPKTGTVYFGSEKGLSTLTTSAVAPVLTFDGLSISPNPFRLPASTALVVDGLVQNSRLKILSIDGQVVKDIGTAGGRVGYWDGTDMQGNFVSSGIYLIVAYSERGNEVAAGKVAVIRR